MSENSDAGQTGNEPEIVLGGDGLRRVTKPPRSAPLSWPDFSDVTGLNAHGGLTNTSTGKWSLSTLSGTGYYLDLDDRFVARRPTAEDLDGRMRQDGQPIRLLALLFCRIGFEMVFLVDLQFPGTMATRRRSSPVIRIERIDSVPTGGNP
jgi:hypothetical protein